MPTYQEVRPYAVRPGNLFYPLDRQSLNHVLHLGEHRWGTVAEVDNAPAARSTLVTLRDGREFCLQWHERVWVKSVPGDESEDGQ